MRFIIGCGLAMMFSATALHAAVPVKERGPVAAKKPVAKPQKAEVEEYPDYGMLVRAEISKKPEVKPLATPAPERILKEPIGGPALADVTAPPRRKATVLAPHRTMKPLSTELVQVAQNRDVQPSKETTASFIRVIDPDTVIAADLGPQKPSVFEIDLTDLH